jgi:hypothetical protein
MEYQRKRSCKQCRLAKTRCNLATPHCQRCERRNLPCKYEHQTANLNIAPSNDGMFHSWVAGTKSTFPAPRSDQVTTQPAGDAGFDQEVTDNVRIPELLDFDIPLDNVDGMYGMEWNNERAIPTTEALPEREVRREVPSDKEVPDVCWYELPSNGLSTTRSPAPRQSVRITPEEGSPYLNDFAISMMRTLQPSSFDIPGWQELGNESRKLTTLLKRKPVKNAGSLFIRNFMWFTIKTHPFNFEDGTLPFFVHRQSSPEICQSGDAAEALANCGSILSMYRKRTPACDNLVLKTLLQEIQRIYEQVRSFYSHLIVQVMEAQLK